MLQKVEKAREKALWSTRMVYLELKEASVAEAHSMREKVM